MSVREHGFLYRSIEEAADDDAVLYSSDVSRFTGLSIDRVRRRSNDKTDDFPSSRKVSEHRSIWNAKEIKAWLDSRKTKKGVTDGPR